MSQDTALSKVTGSISGSSGVFLSDTFFRSVLGDRPASCSMDTDGSYPWDNAIGA